MLDHVMVARILLIQRHRSWLISERPMADPVVFGCLFGINVGCSVLPDVFLKMRIF